MVVGLERSKNNHLIIDLNLQSSQTYSVCPSKSVVLNLCLQKAARYAFGYLNLIYLNRLIQQQRGMNYKKIPLNANKFIIKLVAMMKEFPHIIDWSDDGLELEIYNVQLFTTQVHPKYFTTSNYKSFLRQLNMYNFSKMSKRKNSISFRHPNFCKEKEHLFQTITRRKQPKKQLESNPTTFSDSMDQSSKPSLSDYQNNEPCIEAEVKQSLKQMRDALNGKANEAFLRLQRHLEKLLGFDGGNMQSQQKGRLEGQKVLFGDYLSMRRIEDMVRQNRESFTQSDQYYLQYNIFNEELC